VAATCMVCACTALFCLTKKYTLPIVIHIEVRWANVFGWTATCYAISRYFRWQEAGSVSSKKLIRTVSSKQGKRHDRVTHTIYRDMMPKSQNYGVREVSRRCQLLCSGLLKHVYVPTITHTTISPSQSYIEPARLEAGGSWLARLLES
jgi:hypothetical protein